MSTPNNELLRVRFDLKIIASWVATNSRVLDLGCGQGDLLRYLQKHKNVIGTGIEKREDRVAHCIEQGLSVLQGDINEEIDDFADDTFDFVILSQTLQQVYHPSELIRAMLRIGKQAIVSFPNFSHWSVRLQLLLSGYAPITRELPYDWHDTPNIRVITLKDFRRFSRDLGFRIIREAAIRSATGDRPGRLLRCLPNFRAKHGIFMIAKKF